jgi:OOP family OmpA-OmpF porin
MKRIFFSLLLISALTGEFSMAQTAENPWRVRWAFNAIDIFPTNPDADAPFASTQGAFFEGFFRVGDHWSFGGPSIALSRHVKGGFSLGMQAAVNTLTNIEGVSNVEYPYYSLDGFITYSPFNKKVKPYFIMGYGLSSFDTTNGQGDNPYLLSKNASKTYLGGLGLDVRLGEQWYFTLQSSYKNAVESFGIKHFQHEFGLSYDFGRNDRDGDGIADKKDQCPDQPGLKAFNGCPDTDEDGIPDSEDQCPEEPGTAEMQGCPDADQDGIADKDDRCPQQAGTLEMEGCPDTDADTVHDGIDECPEEKGDAENNGCPWPDTDGDGVPDKDDVCPDEKGSMDNNGCPALAEAVIQTINDYGSTINFMAESDRLLGSKTLETLQKIKALLQENPSGVLIIEGYASEDGSERYNKALSLRRAEAVKIYLIELGVDPSRLETIGFGEAAPIDDNSTPRGRAQNRRVQFKAKY